MKSYPKKYRSGSALFIVIVMMAILSVLTLYTLKVSKETVYNLEAINDKLSAKLEAKSLLEKTKYIFTVSPFNTSYIENKGGFKNFPSKITLTGEPFKVENATIRIYDSSAKINAFYLYREAVRGLFQYSNITNSADIAFDSYEDWKDKDNLKHINGAENYYYRYEKGFKYGARNNLAIQALEELKCIRGFKNNYSKIKRFLTFSYRGGALNLNTAPMEILSMMLNITEDQAKQISIIRNKKGNLSFTDIESILGKKLPMFYDVFSTYPSRIVEVEITITNKLAKEKLKATIDFKATEDYPFIVKKFVE